MVALFGCLGIMIWGYKNMSFHSKSMLYMLICASLWSIAGIFIKLIPWNAFVIAGFRSLIAALVLFLYIKKAKIGFIINRKTIAAAVTIAATFFAFVSANKLTTAANAIVLQYCGPVFVLLYECVAQKKRLRWPDVLVVLFTLIGIGLFFFDQIDGGQLLGNLIAILSGVFFAGMFVTTAGVDDRTRMSGILQGHILAMCVGIPLAFVFDTPVTAVSVVCILVLGVFQLGIPYIFYGIAARGCPPLACSLLSALEPLLNPVWVAIFLHEAPSLFALIGGAIVIISITLWCLYDQKHPSYQISESEGELS